MCTLLDRALLSMVEVMMVVCGRLCVDLMLPAFFSPFLDFSRLFSLHLGSLCHHFISSFTRSFVPPFQIFCIFYELYSCFSFWNERSVSGRYQQTLNLINSQGNLLPQLIWNVSCTDAHLTFMMTWPHSSAWRHMRNKAQLRLKCSYNHAKVTFKSSLSKIFWISAMLSGHDRCWIAPM